MAIKTLLQPTSSDRNAASSVRRKLCKVYASYLGIFALFFWGIHAGVGQYWDWSFPYFSDHLDTLFASKASSWTNANMGSPLGYASDYFLRFLVAMFSFLPPELVRYGFLAVVFATGSFGVYLLARRHTTGWLAFLLGLMAFVNPAMFYKYTAGHFNYMVSLTLFIYLLYYLLYRFRRDLRSAVVVGLFFGLLGFQIQFFIITAIFLGVYFLFNRQQLAFKYALVILAVPVLLNLVWLSNFISGATSAAETGAQAAKVTFKALSGSDFLSIFTFSFAKATLLSKFYAFYELLWNAALFIFLLWLLVREKQKQTFDIILLVFMSIMIFMATGLYQVLPLGPITMLYPMLREVGHFAPVIVLVCLLLIARLVQTSTWRWALTFVLVGSLFIVGVKFQYFSQGYSFADAREKFAPFKELADADTSKYRVLAYPFFDQYSFKDIPKDPPGQLPLKNSGHDSFATFSPQSYITNTVAPHNFQESLQYKLLQDYDIDVLRPYNVKYIFDFSDIYESNYERYVPPTVYNNDLSLIKNDKQFFDKLLAANPGKLRRVNDKVLEIRDYKAYIGTDVSVFALDKDEYAKPAMLFSRHALEEPLDYVRDDRALAPYTTKLTPLFGDPAKMTADHGMGIFSQTLRPSGKGKTTLYADRLHDTVFYETTGTTLTVFTQSTGQLTVNGQPLYGDTGRRILAEVPLKAGSQYFLAFKDRTVSVKPNTMERLGVGTQNDTIDIFTGTSDNLVQNPSFEAGLWQKDVQDCNNYDFEHNAKLGMKHDASTASEGKTSLELSAAKHDACTYTSVPIEANASYLLRYDYQSPNAQTASFHLGYEKDGAAFAKGAQTILDDRWDTYSTLVTAPEDTGRANLYFYALEQHGQTTVNRYDNVSLVKLENIGRVQIPGLPDQYERIDLPAELEQRFVIEKTGQAFRNIIPNPSFEEGSWQETVSDCRNYDQNGKIAMRLNRNDKTHGSQSLELETTRHDACVRITTDVSANTEYQLSFDYKGQKGKYYGYAISYDDPENTLVRQQLEIKENQVWQRANIRVSTPARATTATLYLYAFEAGDKTTNTIRYDDVSLTELPDFTDRFWIAEAPKEEMHAPGRITFDGDDNTRKAIRVESASTPFFLHLSETYHPKWQLALDNSKVSGGLEGIRPSANGDTVTEHMRMQNYMNGWLVDPQALCEDNGRIREGCSKQADGSYDISLVAEFTPDRWFRINTFISWLTLISCLIFIAASKSREMPTYRLMGYQQWRKIVRRWK